MAALNLAPDIVGPPLNRVTRAAKRLKIAEGLHAIGGITEAEYGAHEAFSAVVTASATGVPGVAGVPIWFGPAMAAALAPALAPLTATVNNLTATVNNLTATVNNIDARQQNSVATDNTDLLQGLRHAATGVVPPGFPGNLGALNALTAGQLGILLGAYGLSMAGDANVRRRRFKQFIGIRP
eukprot:CAMPEP_0119012384 /NCGR_PEP_ID=MMETSP1176-20130426/6596_1 /TAXON_ID=265551 /ORGANISM="Synedropsis recta cf, Strain CCMP1620" /LENGTH=181 /DNA_ID=CAMNT_0006965333 /DNA_START=95 /DNA_END=640 /DNA_ORIENTATION=-